VSVACALPAVVVMLVAVVVVGRDDACAEKCLPSAESVGARGLVMKRREFIKLIGGVAASWPLAARAQQQAMPVIGFVTGSMELSRWFLTGVRNGLAELGYVEGKDFRFEFRDHNFQSDRNPIMFRELADQKVTVLLIAATSQIAPAKAATQSIPVVFFLGSDPVENGFVASLNKPGGNMTGVFNLHSMTTGKRLEVLHELVPSAATFAFLTNPVEVRLSKLETGAAQTAAHSLGLNLLIVNARNLGELEAAFESSVREGAGGMVVGSNGLFVDPTQTTALMARYHLPTISVWDRFVRLGGLISYGTDEAANYRLVGNYAGRILKGEKPADMPVQQATTTKLVINLKTAKAMGITVPTPLLGRADEVIE
jgi:putative tryptophan/tyrosine transport system substrate-binding protein